MSTNLRIKKDNRNSFTLIELLVVLALVAILSVVVILTLNPAELIKQARDSNRLSDLSTINTALNLFSTDVASGFMGTSTVVYVSIPDNASSTCGSLGLPTLPTGYTYSCVTTASLRNTDGTGWIPVNFQRISSNSPISQLPIDPINTTSTRLYYTYVSGGSWELNASIEASKNKLGGSNDLVSKDGGSATSQYEVGNNLTLNPLETGDTSLVGYWNFEEGAAGGGTTAFDYSGYANNGAWNGTSTPAQRYVTGVVGNWAINLNGTSDYINIPNSSSTQITGDLTIMLWITPTDMALRAQTPFQKYYPGEFDLTQQTSGSLTYFGGAGGYDGIHSGSGTLIEGQTTQMVVVRTVSPKQVSFYKDGTLVSSFPLVYAPTNASNNPIQIGMRNWSNKYKGQIDDVRLYNRALSAAEVLSLYNATK